MHYLILTAVIIILVAIYYYRVRSKSPQARESRLRENCRVLLKMPPREADQVIDRLVERERDKNPGKTEEWYLDKVLYDLEKDYR